MTSCIVARDPATGQLGVAAQSCYFALGLVLPWARAGVWAVATQSLVEPGYGPRWLDRSGRSGRCGWRRGLVHEVAVHDQVSRASGDGYSAQANMMAGPGSVRPWPRRSRRPPAPWPSDVCRP